MAASATYVKECNVLKQCSTPFNVSHSASSKKNVTPLLDWMMRKVSNVQKGQRICDKLGKLIQICLKVLKRKWVFLQAQNMINEMED
jgi:hypothetical protein